MTPPMFSLLIIINIIKITMNVIVQMNQVINLFIFLFI